MIKMLKCWISSVSNKLAPHKTPKNPTNHQFRAWNLGNWGNFRTFTLSDLESVNKRSKPRGCGETRLCIWHLADPAGVRQKSSQDRMQIYVLVHILTIRILQVGPLFFDTTWVSADSKAEGSSHVSLPDFVGVCHQGCLQGNHGTYPLSALKNM